MNLILEKIRVRAERLRRFFSQDFVLALSNEGISKFQTRVLKSYAVITKALKTFKDRKIGFQSVALAYFCAMAVVPLLAVCFFLAGGFGLSDRLRGVLTANLPSDQRLVETIMAAADNIIRTGSSGLFGIVSALAFVWLVVWMMNRVERVFNNVWNVSRPSRKFYKSLFVDLAIMLTIPFIILMFSSGAVVYSHALDVLIPNNFGFSDNLKSFLGWMVFALIAILTLSAMYKYIPATWVDYGCALRAAVLAGIAFTVLQYLYLETQLLVTRINAVYGALALVPLFLMWLRFSWLIILYGAQFSYSFQTVKEVEKVVS